MEGIFLHFLSSLDPLSVSLLPVCEGVELHSGPHYRKSNLVKIIAPPQFKKKKKKRMPPLLCDTSKFYSNSGWSHQKSCA